MSRPHASCCVVMAACLVASAGALSVGLLGGCDIILDIDGLDRGTASGSSGSGGSADAGGDASGGGGSADDVDMIVPQQCNPGKIFADEAHVFWTTTASKSATEPACQDDSANGIYRVVVDTPPHSSGQAVVTANVTGDAGGGRPWALTVVDDPAGGQSVYWLGQCGQVLTADALGAMQTADALPAQPPACAGAQGIARTADGRVVFASGCHDGCNPQAGTAGQLYLFDPAEMSSTPALPLTSHYDSTVSVAAGGAPWVAWIDNRPADCAIGGSKDTEVRAQGVDGSLPWSSCDVGRAENLGHDARDVATDGTSVYWLEGEGDAGQGELYQLGLPPDGGPPSAVGGTLAFVHSIAVDDHYVYFTTRGPRGTVQYFPKGVPHPHVTTLVHHGNPFAITAANSKWVFWLDTPVDGGYGSVHRLKKPAPPN